MPISITENSRKILERLIIDKFHSIENDWDGSETEELIKTTKELGMYHLAEELEELAEL